MTPLFTDTHAHLDVDDFKDDLPNLIERAQAAGVVRIFIPAVDEKSVDALLRVCAAYPDYCYPMIGLQPEEVKGNYASVLTRMHDRLVADGAHRFIAIGECGLDFYWTREYEQEQLKAFEEQVKWAVEFQLPLEIHCRKAQNELLAIMRPYMNELPGGVFHCFTGNEQEAMAYLKFSKFCLGIGGVSTFKSSHLRETLPAVVPLDRIVIETDSPYMAPVPHRGQRNEPAFSRLVLQQLAQSYGIDEIELAQITEANVRRVFGIGTDKE